MLQSATENATLGRNHAWFRLALNAARHSGVFSALHRAAPRRLTVLAYHRIADPSRPDFAGLAANVSATPAAFRAQLALVRSLFNVISLNELHAWLRGGAALPAYPLLITFDDGYRDILTHALPALRAVGLPAVLFVATGCIGNPEPFFWDRAAYCFRHTARDAADLPLLGPRAWRDAAARRSILHLWLARAKDRPVSLIAGDVARLQVALDVDVPADAFRDHHLTWDEVRTLARSGVAIGAHTCSHAILSRIPEEEARAEVLRSRHRLESEVGAPVLSFAYPNGCAGDFRLGDVAMLRQEGFVSGFTLIEGPVASEAARRQPLQTGRVLVMADDDDAGFLAKVTGLTRAAHQLRQVLVGRRGGSA